MANKHKNQRRIDRNRRKRKGRRHSFNSDSWKGKRYRELKEDFRRPSRWPNETLN